MESGVPAETFCAVMLGESACNSIATLQPWEVQVDEGPPIVETPTVPEARQIIEMSARLRPSTFPSLPGR